MNEIYQALKIYEFIRRAVKKPRVELQALVADHVRKNSYILLEDGAGVPSGVVFFRQVADAEAAYLTNGSIPESQSGRFLLLTLLYAGKERQTTALKLIRRAFQKHSAATTLVYLRARGKRRSLRIRQVKKAPARPLLSERLRPLAIK